MIAHMIVPKDDQRPEAGWMAGGHYILHSTRGHAIADMACCFTREQQASKTIIRVRLEVADGQESEDEG
jgi:hypothetical protein